MRPRAGAESHADGQFLLATFGPDEQKVGDVGAGDQQDDCDAAHQYPEHRAQFTDNVVLEGPYGGLYACFREHFDAEAGRRREFAIDYGQHARRHRRSPVPG